MNDFLSRFKWILIGGGAVILVAIAVTVGVLVGIGGGNRGDKGKTVTAADVPAPETNQDSGNRATGKGISRVDTQSFEGKGSKTQSFKAGGGLTIIRLTHRGPTNFVVQFGQGDTKQLLVNEVGQFAGSKALGLPAGSYSFEIETTGEWTIQVDQSVPKSAAAAPQKLNGKGQVASNFFSLKEGTAKFRLNYSGGGLFAPSLIKSDGTPVTLLANELGKFTGEKEVQVTSGIYLVDVISSGDWVIDVSQ